MADEYPAVTRKLQARNSVSPMIRCRPATHGTGIANIQNIGIQGGYLRSPEISDCWIARAAMLPAIATKKVNLVHDASANPIATTVAENGRSR